MRLRLLLVATVLLTLTPLVSYGAVPYLINFHGKLSDPSTGDPITGETLDMTFRIYDTETIGTGTLLWEEEHAGVVIQDGIYSLLLGSGFTTVGSMDEALFSSDDRWLEVEVEAELLSPRQRISSVAYALKAGVADRVVESALTTEMIADDAVTSDKIASDEITASHITSGAVRSSEIQDGSISSGDIGFNYAGSLSKGGPASDLACTGCVSLAELDSTEGIGDITAVYAGNGLSGGSLEGDVHLEVVGPLSIGISNWKYSAIKGTQTSGSGGYGVYGENTGSGGNSGYLGSISYGARGEHVSGNFGYLGSTSYGVRGENSNGNYGYLGGASYGARGYHSATGNYGYLGSSTRGAMGYSASGTAGYFDSPSGYGLIVNRGYVGIGTTSPETGLEIYGDGSSWRRGFMCLKNEDEDTGIRLYDSETTVRHHIFNLNADGDVLRLAPAGSYGTGGITISQDGSVGIGTLSPNNELDVLGTIRAEEIIVETGWADYVFKDDYVRMELEQVEKHIEREGHLPGIPTEAEVKEKGVRLGALQVKMLEKIEELTLYLIEQNKEIQIQSDTIREQNQRLSAMRKELDSLRQLVPSNPDSIM